MTITAHAIDPMQGPPMLGAPDLAHVMRRQSQMRASGDFHAVAWTPDGFVREWLATAAFRSAFHS